jgi:hypothetical protein
MWRSGTYPEAPGHASPHVTRRATAGEQGLALVVVLLALALLLAIGSALVLTATIDTRVWMRHRDAAAALHAAEAALTRAIVDLAAEADWTALVAGEGVSVTDGPPGGVRLLPRGGGEVDLTERTHVVRCGRPSGCAERPGQWRLFAWGPLEALVPDSAGPMPLYVIVWISGDPSERDHEDPGNADSADPGERDRPPNADVVHVLAHAYGPAGVHRAVETRLRRSQDAVRIERWVDRRP